MEIISGILPSTLPLFRERAETLKADRQKFLAHLKQVNENLIGNRAKEQAASATPAIRFGLVNLVHPTCSFTSRVQEVRGVSAIEFKQKRRRRRPQAPESAD